MSRANILNTRTINYLELIGNGKGYRVPPYQRDYSWCEEQWEDLWNDVLELRGQPNDRHYMGALVVEGTSDREFLIIDGQQRMATLSILALAVIGKLRTMADRGVEPDRNQERANELRNRFIGEKDPASLVESSRLFLNATDNAFYQDYLVQLRRPLNPRGLPKSNQLLWDCFRYLGDQLDKVSELRDDGEALARVLSETVARQLLFILITVDDELNAYTVFETLNARGLELHDDRPPEELPFLQGEGVGRPGRAPAALAVAHCHSGHGAFSRVPPLPLALRAAEDPKPTPFQTRARSREDTPGCLRAPRRVGGACRAFRRPIRSQSWLLG